MSFDTFCQSITLMALLAYKEAPVPPADKVMALLLFMWRSVNSAETADKAIKDRYGVSSRTVQGHAGSLNVHGSGLFSEMFLSAWQSDGFSNYIIVEPKKEDSTAVLQNIVQKHTSTNPVREDINQVLQNAAASPKKSRDAITRQRSSSSADSPSRQRSVALYGTQIAELFLRKPELAELIYLEICNSGMAQDR
jgi:hypothetical protein